MKISNAHKKLIDVAEEIARVPAAEAGKIAYFPVSLIYTTLPVRDPKVTVYHRKNNGYQLLITGNPDYGVPFGPHPRLFICWLVTQIKLTKEKRFPLGQCYADFLSQLQLGTDSRTRQRIKNQLLRMQYANIKIGRTDKKSSMVKSYDFFSQSVFWWDDKADAKQMTLEQSYVQVSEDFYDMALNAMPIDLRVVEKLKEAPRALDVYMWLTLRMSHLDAPIDLTWEQLYKQFGSIVGADPTPAELDDFRRNFKPILRKVNVAYHEAQFKLTAKAIRLLPSPAHVQKAVK